MRENHLMIRSALAATAATAALITAVAPATAAAPSAVRAEPSGDVLPAPARAAIDAAHAPVAGAPAQVAGAALAGLAHLIPGAARRPPTPPVTTRHLRFGNPPAGVPRAGLLDDGDDRTPDPRLTDPSYADRPAGVLPGDGAGVLPGGTWSITAGGASGDVSVSVPAPPAPPAATPAPVPPTAPRAPAPAAPRLPGPDAPDPSDRAANSGTRTTTDPLVLGAHVYHGLGFEACTAPSLATLQAWRNSPYRAVGIYIGGRARSCAQPKLTRSWVRSVTDMGWSLLPIWVGSQSPCATGERQRRLSISASRANAQGAEEAGQAVDAAASLGILRGSPIYLDMESYSTSSSRCTAPVLDFTRGWSHKLRTQHYFPGFYSSSDSGIRQIENARAKGVADLPGVIWFARWNDAGTLYSEPVLPQNVWRPHRRIHQFVGDTEESYGGYSLAIDRDTIDAPVAIVG